MSVLEHSTRQMSAEHGRQKEEKWGHVRGLEGFKGCPLTLPEAAAFRQRAHPLMQTPICCRVSASTSRSSSLAKVVSISAPEIMQPAAAMSAK